MAFIISIGWKALVDKISDASRCIFLSLPSIDEEMSQLLISVKAESAIDIKICIDNSEVAIRNGYGDEKGIDNLIANGITVLESKGNRVSFIIVDNSGYIYFSESRIFSENPTGPNAIDLDAFTMTRLIAYYFPAQNVLEKEKLQERLEESFEQQKEWIEIMDSEIIDQNINAVTIEFNSDHYNKIKQSLLQNKVVSPNLQRQIKTYNAKIQFVELKFSGINLQSRTISIPKDALPINNIELKKLLQTKMKLFQNMEGNKDFAIFEELKREVEKLREDYLKPITCREGKSILDLTLKEEFKSSLQQIKNKIKELNNQLPDILEMATMQSKDLIKEELFKFFTANEPVELKQYLNPEIKVRKLTEFVDRLVYRIPFPKTEKLIENISLIDYYYDLTFQDFSDEKLIEEFKKKKIMGTKDIEGIVEMKNAFEEKI